MKRSTQWLSSNANKLNTEDSKKFHESIQKEVDSGTLAKQRKLIKAARSANS